jgi:hypothetical protein
MIVIRCMWSQKLIFDEVKGEPKQAFDGQSDVNQGQNSKDSVRLPTPTSRLNSRSCIPPSMAPDFSVRAALVIYITDFDLCINNATNSPHPSTITTNLFPFLFISLVFF